MNYNLTKLKSLQFFKSITFLIFFVSWFSNAQVPTSERNALVALYDATDGANWNNNTNWNSSEPVDTWHGVMVVDNHVREINLIGNQLSGTIPSTIENLTNLEVLKLDINDIQGTIPNTITNLASLKHLELSGNNLEGSIPANITNLTTLLSLSLANNALSGTVPDFSTMPNISWINIFNNNFDFIDFEPNIDNNLNLTNFHYYVQNRRGEAETIDAEIGLDYSLSMTTIEGTDVNYQWYRNTNEIIPSETNSQLDIIDFQEDDYDAYVCYATSPFVPDLIIRTEDIDLRGPVSQQERDALISIYNATNGPNWEDTENWATSTPVHTWSGVSTTGNRVTKLVMQSTNPVGVLPETIGNLVNLEELYIGFTDFNLTGTIPESIGNLVELRTFWIQGTGMSGTIPESIGNLTKLRDLKFLGNNFYGELPASMGNLTQLTKLNLNGINFGNYGSNFSGAIPESFSNLTNLYSVSLDNNSFTDAIPFNAPNAIISIVENNFDFNDLEPFVQAENYQNLVYSPQLTEDEPETIETGIGADIVLYSYVPGTDRDGNDTAMSNTYQWFKDNVAIPGANAAQYTITNAQESDSGEYICEITNSTVEGLIIVREPITLVVDESLGFEELNEDTVSFYPVPVKNWLNIKTNELSKATLSIYDLNGRMIMSKSINGSINSLNLQLLQAGTYILELKNDVTSVTKPFIKK